MRAVPPAAAPFVCVCLLASAGCDRDSPAQPTETLPSDGRLEIRAGEFEHDVSLAAASCDSSDDGPTVVRAFDTEQPADAPAKSRRPHHLALKLPELPTAAGDDVRLRGETQWQATASLFSVKLHGYNYGMLQFVAAPVSGLSSDPECDVTHTGDRATWNITCRGVQPIPWLDSGDIPQTAFRATFTCEESPPADD